MPWSKDPDVGIIDADLVRAVAGRDMRWLRHCYDELLRAKWVEDSDQNRWRFLALCHHCARHPNIAKRVGTLQRKIRAKLDVATITDTSDVWANIWLYAFEEPDDRDRIRQTRERETRYRSSQLAEVAK